MTTKATTRPTTIPTGQRVTLSTVKEDGSANGSGGSGGSGGMSEFMRALRLQLRRQHPFFAAPMFKYLKLVERGSHDAIGPVPCATAFVNMHELHINVDFLQSLDPRVQLFVLAHEVTHRIMCHPWWSSIWSRKGLIASDLPFDAGLYNCACDYWINDMLQRNGFTLWSKCLIDDDLTSDMSVVEIYRLLYEDRQAQAQAKPEPGDGEPDGEDDGNPMRGDVQPGAPTDKGTSKQDGTSKGDGTSKSDDEPSLAEQEERARREEQRVVTEAVAIAEAAKGRGTVPGAFASMIAEFRTAQIPWHAALLQLLQARSGSGAARRGRPYKSKMILAEPYIKRRPSSMTMDTLVVGVDTSGSVSDKELAHFFGELVFILEECTPETMHVVWFDAEVQRVDTFGSDDVLDGAETLIQVAKAVPGRGGTDFNAVLDWLSKEKIVPDQLVYLTDMMAPFPQEPDVPTVWVSSGYVHDKAPWGITLRLDPTRR